MRLTIIGALVVFALHNWITPPANQAFREQVVLSRAAAAGKIAEYRRPGRGLREMTLSQVFFASVSAPSPYAVASPSKLREELFRRIALPLVPVVLAILGWRLTRVSRTAGPARLFGWWAFASITYGLASSSGMTLERWWNTPREVAVWLPLALWCGAIAVLIRATPGSASPGRAHI